MRLGESPQTLGKECHMRMHVDFPCFSWLSPPRSYPAPCWGQPSGLWRGIIHQQAVCLSAHQSQQASFLAHSCFWFWGFPGGSDSRESACNARDPGSTPGSGRSPGEGNSVLSSTLARRIPWTEEPGGLQSVASQESQT